MSHHQDSDFEDSTMDDTLVADDKIVRWKEALARDLEEFEALIDKIATGGSEDCVAAAAKCQKRIEALEAAIQL